MTKVMFNADPINGIYYECLNHADDHDVCTIISTLSNVMVEACLMADCEPTEYSSGHVRIDMPPTEIDDYTMYVFKVVYKQILNVARLHPENVKIY